MRAYKWFLIGGSIMLLAFSLSLFFDSPNRVSATSGPNCDVDKCSFIDTTINDFQVGQFAYTSLNNATGDGSVQLLPVGLTSPWITDTYTISPSRSELTAVAYKDYIYVIGGQDNNSPRHPQKQILKATVNSNGSIASPGFVAVSNADLPFGRSGASAVISTTASGAWLYVLGGNTDQFNTPIITSTIYYNFIDTNGNFPQPSNWRTATMPPYGFPDGELVYYQAIVNNGYLYVIGGADAFYNPYSDIYRASINGSTGALGSWQAETNLPNIFRKSFAATTWRSPTGTNFLYLLGGLKANDYIAQSQGDFTSFNNTNGSLNPFPDPTNNGAALPLGYYAHGAVQSNNVLYVTAGNPGGLDTNITTTVQSALIDDTNGTLRNIILGTTNPWITSNPLPQGRKYHATVIGSNNGEVYVIGGYGPDGIGTNTVYHGSTRGFGANYAPNGNYTSKAINMVSQRNVNQIVVNTTITSSVTMTLQYRYGNSEAGLGNWINLPSVQPGVNSSNVFPVNFTASYIQYRAFLTTTLSNVSPALNAFEVRYPPPPTPTPTNTPIGGGGGTPTPTRIPGIPDFTILGMQSPDSTQSMSQTITVRVANQGTGFNRRPVTKSSSAVVGQQSGPIGTRRALLPSGISGTSAYTGTSNYFFYVEVYVDPSSAPTKVTDLGNCPTIGGGTNWGWVYALGVGEYVDVPIVCYLPSAGLYQYYSQVDSCDDLGGNRCSITYGYVLEGYETNNIFGPVPSGTPLSGGPFLPLIQKSP